MSELLRTIHPAIKRLFSTVVGRNLGTFKPLARCSKCNFYKILSREDVYRLIERLSGRRASLSIRCPHCHSKSLYVEKTPEKACSDCSKPIDLARRIFAPDRPVCKACQVSFEVAYGMLFPGKPTPFRR